MSKPLISVITPVYNMASFIRVAIESVLEQTINDFELLLIDDCSTDNSLDILNEYAAKDSRVRIFSTPVNSWAHAAGNVGLENATGTYIAILDADDALPHDRFERQLAAFEADPDLDVCGGWMKMFGDSNKTISSFLSEDMRIRMELLFDSSMGHGTAMIRRSVIEAHSIRYNTEIFYAHDYHFFTQLAFDGHAKFIGIPHVLYFYRLHAEQTSTARKQEQIGFSDVVRKSVLSRFRITNPDMIAIHLHLCHKEPYKINTSNSQIVAYYEALIKSNRELGIFPELPFMQHTADRICRDMRRCGLRGLMFYISFPYKKELGWPCLKILRFILKCLRPARRRSAPSSEIRQ